MTLLEFNKYLKENITDEIFESLVLYYLKTRFFVLNCNIDEHGNKCYIVQDTSVGDTYVLIINNLNADIYKEYPTDRFMIAKNDEQTATALVKYACQENAVNKTPNNARNILSHIKKNYPDYVLREGVSFAENINQIVNKKYNNYEDKMAKLYDAVVNETAKRLVAEGFLENLSDWNAKKGKFKLTGAKGENRECECRICLGIGCVYFTVKEPLYPMHYFLADEKDVPILANRIVKVIKEKRTF